MPQKYGAMANAVPGSRDFTCVVCGDNPPTWTWSDLHGEAMCIKCGTPYQLIQYEEVDGERKRLDAPPKINIKPGYIPILKQYWEETKKFTGLGTIMIGRDYPECVEGCKAFYKWLDAHKELIPSEEGVT